MISFTICKRCEHGSFHNPTYDEDGEMEVCPYVECAKEENVMLLMNCDPPADCPFAMEHALVTQAETKKFADWMSGGAAKNSRRMSERKDERQTLEMIRRGL